MVWRMLLATSALVLFPACGTDSVRDEPSPEREVVEVVDAEAARYDQSICENAEALLNDRLYDLYNYMLWEDPGGLAECPPEIYEDTGEPLPEECWGYWTQNLQGCTSYKATFEELIAVKDALRQVCDINFDSSLECMVRSMIENCKPDHSCR